MERSRDFPIGERVARRRAFAPHAAWSVVAALGLASFAAAQAGAQPARAERAIGMLVASGDALAEQRVRGAQLALDEVNAANTSDRPRFVLRVARVENPWLTSADVARKLVRDERCEALIAPPDRDVSHLAAQMALRATLPLATLSPDSSLTRVPSPWIVRPVPDDRAELATLVRALEPRPARIAALIPSGRAGGSVRADLAWLANELGVRFEPVIALGAPGAIGDEANGAAPSAETVAAATLAALRGHEDQPLALWLAEPQALATLAKIETLGWRGPLLIPRAAAEGELGRACARAGFTANAIELAVDARFADAFVRAFDRAADPAAATAHDAALLSSRALDGDDTSLLAVRERLTSIHELAGASGLVRLDSAGNRCGDWTVRTFAPSTAASALDRSSRTPHTLDPRR
jgi:ABC-type branched-subunit amino acid transport system substrate-binding protein